MAYHTPVVSFLHREWACTLIARSLSELESEYAEKEEFFTVLKLWLDGGVTSSQAEAAQALGMSETTVKVASHRLYTRFRKRICAEIPATADDTSEAIEELRQLIAIVNAGS